MEPTGPMETPPHSSASSATASPRRRYRRYGKTYKKNDDSGPGPDHTATQPTQNNNNKVKQAQKESDVPSEGRRSPTNVDKNNHNHKIARAHGKDPKLACKIIVKDYPTYTQQQELAVIFAQYGNVRIEKISRYCAVLCFTTPEEAKVAIQASRSVNLYGHFLSVRPYEEYLAKEAMQQQKQDQKKCPKSKQKSSVIVEPGQLQLTGDFHAQLDRLLAAVRLTQEEVTRLAQLYEHIETALQEAWPGCLAMPFGSITTGLGIKTSDADCFVSLPPQHRHQSANCVNKAKRLFHARPEHFDEIVPIPRANTPIIKLFHIPTETNCDVSFKTPLGVQNSRLIAFLLHSDPRLLPTAVAVKYWAKVHDLSGTGKLTNYALTMMIIFYLQQPPVSLLPAVAWLQRDRANDVYVDGWNTGFMSQRALLPPTSCTANIAELLGGFFEFYSLFDFDEVMVCPYLGTPLKKDLFKAPGDLPPAYAQYRYLVESGACLPLRFVTPLCVQDPFEQCHNVASSVSPRFAADLKAYFKFAANAYEKEKLNDCADFLKVILLQKPKLATTRNKSQLEYRINLFPRMIGNILESDWRGVVREVLITIFEKILKIKLGKVEEKVMDSRKKKEKYTGAVTRAIWKRRQLSRLYNNMVKLDLVDRESKITEEIMNVDKTTLNVQFQLTVTYCHEPKSAVLSTKLVNGDLENFKEFGKFFFSVMQQWFSHLLKPYSANTENKTAEKIAQTIKEKDLVSDTKQENKQATSAEPEIESDSDEAAAASPADLEPLDPAPHKPDLCAILTAGLKIK